jgi:glycosyltransferase involved in cell wall biosynthesis
MAGMMPRVLVMTAGHLATCPRMLKAADALAERYDVRVVSTNHTTWAREADVELRQSRGWRWTIVDYDRRSAPSTYFWSGARHRAAGRAASTLGPAHVPFGVASRALSRVHDELVRAALAEPFDFVYGGTTGVLAAVAEAASGAGVPYALDLEDFHSGEHDTQQGWLANALASRIERTVISGAVFVTTASAAIADAYRQEYRVEPTVINNTFPLPRNVPDFASARNDRLALYWFSQTIGPGRGLEDAIAAMGLANVPGELHLRGRPLNGYVGALRDRAAAGAPRLAIVHHPPAAADTMIDVARGHDIGLALEQMAVPSRRFCLTNKVLTYILAGLAVALTDTPGQRAIGRDLGEAAGLVPPGDAGALASVFAGWWQDPELLQRAKRAAWDAAVRRWHWEHPSERGALLDLVARAVSGNGTGHEPLPPIH